MNDIFLSLRTSSVTEIYDDFGKVVGSYDYTISMDASMFPVSFKYSAGLFYYISQIENFAWPVGFLTHIEVTNRHLGYGSLGLEMFYSKVREHGIKLCMLYVGWNNNEEDYNLNWYKKRGWTLLNDATPWRNPLYLMYKWI
jgi:hypothetical protein